MRLQTIINTLAVCGLLRVSVYADRHASVNAAALLTASMLCDTDLQRMGAS